MIVTDEHVTTSLEYLNDDPHPMAIARKELTDAENKSKRIFASAFLASNGSVEARKAMAEVHPDYVAAKNAEAEAIKELERHRQRIKSAEMLIEVWRTEQSNARVAERIR